jgi:cell division protein FtsB
MKEFQDKHIVKRRIYSKTSIVILSIVLLFTAKGVVSVYQKEKLSRTEVERVQKQKDDLQKRYDLLSSNSDELKTNEGIEAEIRTKFDVVKEGESVIVVVDKDSPVIQEDKRGTIKKLWDTMLDVFRSDKKTEN